MGQKADVSHWNQQLERVGLSCKFRMTKQSWELAGCGREQSRADGYKLSLGVIADCGNVVTQSAEIRKDTDTKTPKEAEVYQWPRAGPSVSPAWQNWPWLVAGREAWQDLQDELGMLLANQNYKCTRLYLLRGCVEKRKDEKCQHEIEPQSLVKESGLSLEHHQRSNSLWPLQSLPGVQPFVRSKGGKKPSQG